jgi:hypothetical protein|uniref:Uncharacterized protein n=1 Tax=viral metagenome TaxID=1070528 RepID=A0A6C0E221_9ZZZZ
MSFTRFHDDPARIRKQLEESTFAEQYYLNMPGNGVNMHFQLDPQLRLQGWGANLHTNAIRLESDFRGLTRRLNHDLIDENNYVTNSVKTVPYTYENANPVTDETRATHPAWTLRGLEQSRWGFPLSHPRDSAEIPFLTNIQTRHLEKENYLHRPSVTNPVA